MSGPLIQQGASIQDAVRAIEAGRIGIAVMVDDGGRLLGTITDGDIRRAILAGHTLSTSATAAMRSNPFTVTPDIPDVRLLRMLRERGLEAAPIVDRSGRLQRIVHVRHLEQAEAAVVGGGEGYYGVVIMAGGEGRRLRPFTHDTPKPMLTVGGMPILERLIRSFVRARIPRIFVAINYLSHVIEGYFGDGKSIGASIAYLRENEKKGTAGALTLLPEKPSGPLLVINGDVLTSFDSGALYAYHSEGAADITVAASEYRLQIPYGVIQNDGDRVVALQEKPSQRFLCNAGIYVLMPDVLSFIPSEGAFDMPALIDAAVSSGRNVKVFPIYEYWTDIGSPEDFARAKADAGHL